MSYKLRSVDVFFKVLTCLLVSRLFLWCFSFLGNCPFQVSFNLKLILNVAKITKLISSNVMILSYFS